jgi:hypothetical protein
MFFGVISIFIFPACKKEKSTEAVFTVSHCGYAPYSTGSAFTYQYINSSNTSSQYTLNVTGDTTIDGAVYAKLNNGYTDQYVRCDNGRYYLYEEAISVQDYALIPGSRLFLNDNLPKGATWNDTITAIVSGMPQKGILQYQIIQKDTTRTVLGKQYKNVIGVRQDAALEMLGTTYPIGNIATYYYAENIGYIETVSPTDTIRLISYDIR